MDLVIIIDGSGSVEDDVRNNWYYVKKFLNHILDILIIDPYNTKMAVITYGNVAKLDFSLNEYTNSDDIRNAIDNLHYDVSKSTRIILYSTIIYTNNNNNNNKYLLEESCTFFSYEVFKLIILLFPLKGFR